MLKKLLVLCLVVLSSRSLSFASRGYVIDTPTIGVLNYASYEISFKFFSQGNFLPKLDLGVFRILNIGLSWELESLIGNKNIGIAIPALQVKLKLFEGTMLIPGFAIGYDGQGYDFNSQLDGNYLQRERGVYLVAGKELFLKNLIFNAGISINELSDIKLRGFVNAFAEVIPDSLYLLTEYDNIYSIDSARLNFGVKFCLTEFISIDTIIRDCFRKSSDIRYANERMIRINYLGRF
ncbi:MAG: hypothetical protein LBU55_02000 [Elusimicrobiota bacterium]|jgi:hypothetical protein|nr:hypothetical protein [Elusimicrobiota bacterium]